MHKRKHNQAEIIAGCLILSSDESCTVWINLCILFSTVSFNLATKPLQTVPKTFLGPVWLALFCYLLCFLCFAVLHINFSLTFCVKNCGKSSKTLLKSKKSCSTIDYTEINSQYFWFSPGNIVLLCVLMFYAKSAIIFFVHFQLCRLLQIFCFVLWVFGLKTWKVHGSVCDCGTGKMLFIKTNIYIIIIFRVFRAFLLCILYDFKYFFFGLIYVTLYIYCLGNDCESYELLYTAIYELWHCEKISFNPTNFPHFIAETLALNVQNVAVLFAPQTGCDELAN